MLSIIWMMICSAFGVAIILFTLYFTMCKSNAKQENIYREFLDAEHQANFSRKKDPESEDYLQVDIHTLPIREYPDEAKYSRVVTRQNNILEISRLPMICGVRGLSNRALKLKYGTANLDTIVTYEENYNRLIHNLLEWAAALNALGNTTDAFAVLETAVEYDCDRSQAYTMLADLITDRARLEALRKKAQSILSGSAAERTLAYIDMRMSEIK